MADETQLSTHSEHIIMEWSKQYVEKQKYNKIIEQLINLQDIIKDNGKTHLYEGSKLKYMYQEIENEFWLQVETDLAKIQGFYEKEVAVGIDRVI